MATDSIRVRELVGAFDIFGQLASAPARGGQPVAPPGGRAGSGGSAQSASKKRRAEAAAGGQPRAAPLGPATQPVAAPAAANQAAAQRAASRLPAGQPPEQRHPAAAQHPPPSAPTRRMAAPAPSASGPAQQAQLRGGAQPWIPRPSLNTNSWAAAAVRGATPQQVEEQHALPQDAPAQQGEQQEPAQQQAQQGEQQVPAQQRAQHGEQQEPAQRRQAEQQSVVSASMAGSASFGQQAAPAFPLQAADSATVLVELFQAFDDPAAQEAGLTWALLEHTIRLADSYPGRIAGRLALVYGYLAQRRYAEVTALLTGAADFYRLP